MSAKKNKSAMGMKGGSTKEGEGVWPPYPGQAPLSWFWANPRVSFPFEPLFWQSTRGGQEAKNHFGTKIPHSTWMTYLVGPKCKWTFIHQKSHLLDLNPNLARTQKVVMSVIVSPLPSLLLTPLPSHINKKGPNTPFSSMSLYYGLGPNTN